MRGIVAPDLRDWLVTAGWFLLLAVALGRASVRRRKASDQPTDSPRFDIHRWLALVTPWIVFIASLLLVKAIGDEIGLAREASLSFSRFKDLLDETDGNLGAHLRRLEDRGYIAVAKGFLGRKPQTRYSLTDQGRQHLTAHLNALQALLTNNVES